MLVEDAVGCAAERDELLEGCDSLVRTPASREVLKAVVEWLAVLGHYRQSEGDLQTRIREVEDARERRRRALLTLQQYRARLEAVMAAAEAGKE